jgi:hypothetical protein
MAITLTYETLVDLIGGREMNEQRQSRQLLVWFLENYYRLDPIDAADSVCDKPYDKGIDGIYVNEEFNQIDVFQSTLKTTAKTLGDKALKEFVGSLSQLTTPEGVEHLIATTQNPELKALLTTREIATKIRQGYEVRGIFVTNAERDVNSNEYLAITPILTVYDKVKLEELYVPIDSFSSVQTEIFFDLHDVQHIILELDADTSMVIAPIRATELVKMDGIVSGELFAPNVRQWLGKKTKVNRDLASSIETQEDHKFFPAFHNGLTVLCESLMMFTHDEDKDPLEDASAAIGISIKGYGVVNGCQSVRGLYEKRSELTPELRILTKFISVAPDTELALKITDHTNNQNGISARDLKSNNIIQRRLQSEVEEVFGGSIHYRTKRGEHPEWPKDTVLENSDAGRYLLAFDLKKPEACHQTYKVFDEFYADIFSRPQATAHRIVMLADLYQAIQTQLRSMQNILFGEYGLTPYFVLSLVREALDNDEAGKTFIENPASFLEQNEGRNRIKSCLESIAGDLVTMLDTEASARSEGDLYFDYKTDLKSPVQVRSLKSTIIGQYRVAVRNRYVNPFSKLWSNTEPFELKV